jgi:exo-1,4-beta-D-glucosaminidase
MWQVYDWYLRPNAGYYYARKASQPLHVQLHPGTHVVSGVNASFSPARGLTLEVEIYDERANRVGRATQPVELDAEDSREILPLADVSGWDADAFRFVRLRVADAWGEIVDENLYWLAPENDFTPLNDLPTVELTASAHRERQGEQVWVMLTLTNPSEHLAFFVNPTLTRGQGGEEILPTFWNDNYFSLLPGETRSVTAYIDEFRLEGEAAHVRLEGWNVTTSDVPVEERE